MTPNTQPPQAEPVPFADNYSTADFRARLMEHFLKARNKAIAEAGSWEGRPITPSAAME